MEHGAGIKVDRVISLRPGWVVTCVLIHPAAGHEGAERIGTHRITGDGIRKSGVVVRQPVLIDQIATGRRLRVQIGRGGGTGIECVLSKQAPINHRQLSHLRQSRDALGGR